MGDILNHSPSIVDYYNQNMGGVDIFDQELTYYSFQRKPNRWTYKLTIYLLQTIMFNSYVLYIQRHLNQTLNHTLNIY